jgi:hypothetical protein
VISGKSLPTGIKQAISVLGWSVGWAACWCWVVGSRIVLDFRSQFQVILKLISGNFEQAISISSDFDFQQWARQWERLVGQWERPDGWWAVGSDFL